MPIKIARAAPDSSALGPATLLYTLESVEDVTVHGRWLYFIAGWRGDERSERGLLRIPASGGAAETIAHQAHPPFALAGGRVWYTHYEGVASLPLAE